MQVLECPYSCEVEARRPWPASCRPFSSFSFHHSRRGFSRERNLCKAASALSALSAQKVRKMGVRRLDGSERRMRHCGASSEQHQRAGQGMPGPARKHSGSFRSLRKLGDGWISGLGPRARMKFANGPSFWIHLRVPYFCKVQIFRIGHLMRHDLGETSLEKLRRKFKKA